MVCRPGREESKKGTGAPPSPTGLLRSPSTLWQNPLLPHVRRMRNPQEKGEAHLLCLASYPLIGVPRRVRIWREGQSGWGISGPRFPHPQPQLRLQSLLVVAEREQRDGQ